jgi:hypothetical protein
MRRCLPRAPPGRRWPPRSANRSMHFHVNGDQVCRCAGFCNPARNQPSSSAKVTVFPSLNRRRFLQGFTLLPIVSLPLLQGCNKTSSSPCSDPALLSRGEEQMRKTLEYLEVTTVENKECAQCQFFSAADERGCGHCEILAGSVNGQGYCTSWAHRG